MHQHCLLVYMQASYQKCMQIMHSVLATPVHTKEQGGHQPAGIAYCIIAHHVHVLQVIFLTNGTQYVQK